MFTVKTWPSACHCPVKGLLPRKARKEKLSTWMWEGPAEVCILLDADLFPWQETTSALHFYFLLSVLRDI